MEHKELLTQLEDGGDTTSEYYLAIKGNKEALHRTLSDELTAAQQARDDRKYDKIKAVL